MDPRESLGNSVCFAPRAGRTLNRATGFGQALWALAKNVGLTRLFVNLPE